jgi:hypothetical protein
MRTEEFQNGYSEGLKAGLHRGYSRARGELTSKVNPKLGPRPGKTPLEYREMVEKTEIEKSRILTQEYWAGMEQLAGEGPTIDKVFSTEHYRVVFNGKLTETIHPNINLAKKELIRLFVERKNQNDSGHVLKSELTAALMDLDGVVFFDQKPWKQETGAMSPEKKKRASSDRN